MGRRLGEGHASGSETHLASLSVPTLKMNVMMVLAPRDYRRSRIAARFAALSVMAAAMALRISALLMSAG